MKAIGLAVALVVLGAGSAALAAPAPVDDTTRDMKFGPKTLCPVGERCLKGPDVDWVPVRRHTDGWLPLLKLRTDFNPELQKSLDSL